MPTDGVLEKMEAGDVVMAKKDKCNRVRLWITTLLLSILISVISLLILFWKNQQYG
jgi:hypothetical protein